MTKPKNEKERIIVTLLCDSMKEAQKFVNLLKGDVNFFEVGLSTYTALGPDVIKMIKDNGCKVFLDLKYHDIPSSVGRAVETASSLGVDMLTVHAAGGMEMLRAAVLAAKGSLTSPKIIAVTVLTSMESLGDIGIQFEVREQVVRLAKLAKDCGCDGVLASPLEIRPIRNACGPKISIITSGVRPLGTDAQDQRRIASPTMAIAAGADYLIVGRPIVLAKDPRAVVKKMLKEITI